MFVYYNANPEHNTIEDCVIRAVSVFTHSDWESTFINLCALALSKHLLPDHNAVWTEYLANLGYARRPTPDTCPDCYTIIDFCRDHPHGEFLVGTGQHAFRNCATTDSARLHSTADFADNKRPHSGVC